MTDTKRLPGETETQYIWRICSAKDVGTLDITWDEVADILNKELRDEGEYYTSSAYRKKYQMAKLFRDEVFSKESDSETERKYVEQKRELEQLKIQFRDERNAWNRQNYATARFNQDMNYLAEQLKQIGNKEFLVFDFYEFDSPRDLIVCLSDTHFGETFSNRFGTYDTSIAKERLEEYLDKIIEVGIVHKAESVYLACLGDLVSGTIHHSIQVSNRENIIDQIKISAEYIANFCTVLAEHFKNVYVYGVAGNHSRIQASKELDIKDERYDSLIMWIVSCLLSHLSNVKVCTDNIDSTIAEMTVRGKDYCLIHGDYDSWNANDIGKLSLMLNKFPYAILNGHRHTPAYKEVNGIKLVQSGSLSGSGDDYTLTKRLCGSPNQTILVVDEYGIQDICPIDLL